MPVNGHHEEYKAMIHKWERCRDVAAGQDAVHKGGEKYLPKLRDQLPEDYNAYVLRTPFYNATWRTIAGLVGMLFRQPPKIEAPQSIKDDMFDDITMSGVPLQMFVQEVCEEALKCGRLGLLVDYPTVSTEGLTQADAQKMNLRPMMQIYRAESIINWRIGRVDNVSVLTMVVLKEKTEVPQDEFVSKWEDRFRVLDLVNKQYRVRVFKIEGEKEILVSTAVPLMNNVPLDYIPFTFASTDDNQMEVDEPPLIDLVDLNLSHYRTSADLEHGAHFTGLPTAVISGYKPENPNDKLYIGSTAAWVFPDPAAKATYLEFSGEGLGALEKLLEAKEKRMAILGARMLEQQKRGVETADTASIHRKGEESMLSAAAQSISLSVTRALEWFVDWTGTGGENVEVKFELNRDFYPVAMTDKMLNALVAAWQAGAISSEVLFENLQQGEVISQETEFEEEQTRLQNQGPTLTGQNIDPRTGLPTASPPQLPKDNAPQPGAVIINLPKGSGKRTVTGPDGRKYTIVEE